MFVKDLFGYGILTSVYVFGVDRCGAIYVIQWKYAEHNI